jgi:hypothetical protein
MKPATQQQEPFPATFVAVSGDTRHASTTKTATNSVVVAVANLRPPILPTQTATQPATGGRGGYSKPPLLTPRPATELALALWRSLLAGIFRTAIEIAGTGGDLFARRHIGSGYLRARRHRGGGHPSIVCRCCRSRKLEKPSPSRQRMLQAGTAVARMGLNGRDLLCNFW